MLKKEIIYVFTVFLLIFIMLFRPVRDVVRGTASDFFYPFFSLVLKIENIVNRKIFTLKSKNDLITELSELQKNNYELSAKCDHLEEVVNENSELRRLLELKVNPYYNYIFAEIIYRDPVQWFNHFTINKGKNDGIENGAVVLARINTDNTSISEPNPFSKLGRANQPQIGHSEFHGASYRKSQFGVVGRISSISKHTAFVSTIVSDECNLSVLIPENSATGVLIGGKRIGREFRSKISYLPRDLIYKSSSSVFTSGMNALTPANLKVGSIMGENSAVVSIYNNLFAEAGLKPAVDLNHLKFVLILVKKQ